MFGEGGEDMDHEAICVRHIHGYEFDAAFHQG